MKTHPRKYNAFLDTTLFLLFAFAGQAVFVVVNLIRWYLLDIRDTWWPNTDDDHKAFIAFLFGSVPALCLLRFWLYRRWKW